MTKLFTPEMVEVLHWPVGMQPSEWADRHRVLGQGSAEPGPWRTARVPYTREIMDTAEAAWVRRVTWMKSTQIGGTETLLNVVANAIAQDPGPVMFVMPSREEAEQFCDLRVLPMVRLCPALQQQLGEDRGDVKMRMLRFRRCVVLFRTARVAADLSQLAIQHLFGDEVDQWIENVQGEGNPWKVALERTRTFKGRWKAWMTSTPTLPEGLVHQEFLAGDRRRFHVPCPHCREWIVFEWEQVKWPPEITDAETMHQRKEAWYECQRCGGKIDDTQKHQAVEHGDWVPEGWKSIDWFARRANEDRATHRSYHLWAAYSPWLSWFEIAATHLLFAAQGAPREFWNKWLGLPWKETVRETKDDDLQRCRRPYRHGAAAPDGVRWIVAGVDSQSYFLPYVVRGWGLDGRSWLLDHGRAESFQALEAALFGRDWAGEDHRRAYLQVMLVLIDARWREKEVADFARKWGPQLVRLSKGSEMKGAQAFTEKLLDRHPVTGEILREGLRQLAVNTGLFKSRLAHAIAISAGGQDEGGFMVYQDIDPTYVQEMTAEQLVVDRTGREPTERWEVKEGRRANHFWDAETLTFAAARILMIEQVRAEQLREQVAKERAPKDQPPRRRPRDEDDDDGGGGPRLWRRQ